MKSPIYTIYAGVNGAGKTTLYHQKSFDKREVDIRINSDEILKENGGDWRNSTDQKNAMMEAIRRIKKCLDQRISFNQETTLTGHVIVQNIKKAKEKGFIIKLHYVGLESADLAVQRVRNRVERGGHGIAEEDIRRRYEQSLQNLKKVISLCDEVAIYDNTKVFRNIANYQNGQNVYTDPDMKCEWYRNFSLDRVKEETS